MVCHLIEGTAAYRRQAAIALGTTVVFAAVAAAAAAQTGGTRNNVPTSKAAPVVKTAPQSRSAAASAPQSRSAAASAPQWTTEEAAAREKILGSPAWNDTLHQFEEWLSAQPLYDAAEVKRIRSRLEIGISRMSAGQLQRFIADMQEKLQVLTSPQAQQAGAYLAQMFAVASPAYAQRIRQKLPDVLTMTAAQINQQLAIFAAKQQATVQMQKTFEDSRTQQIANNQQLLAAQQANQAAAAQSGSAAAAAATKGNNFTPARDYFPDAGNDGPFGPGTSIGIGWGFF